ncbi:alkaline phosphatase family protein [Pseudogracilibacillus sp. SE30717A]|uniref:alkaline phosphatase family protein n=1 Tax=Pseudogracilibacillus sp. SE30717A TaxID=3098293 RepID=UPI00300DD74C
MKNKPVILLNIDSLMTYPLEIAIQTGRAPALQFLKENGTYFNNMVSSFPTMSVTIDSSLLTGTYADQHHISGLSWFDTSKKEIVNYGTGFRETFRLGTRRSIHNMLYRLNNEHLSSNVSTIFEELANRDIPSASINSFVYRGNTPKKLKVPGLFKTLTHFKDGEWIMEAPPVLSLGAFSKLKPLNFTFQVAAGNNKYAARELIYLIRKNRLPAFAFCTFQDLDFRIHLKGPLDIKGITRIDKQLQKILNVYSSWDEALRKNIWLIMGDNGHSATHTKYKESVIDLVKLFKQYRIAKLERPIHRKDQFVFCVNQRMSYIYILDAMLEETKIVDRLKRDKRIDVIAWKEENWIRVESPLKHGSLHYRPSEEVLDEYDQGWKVRGEMDILDLRMNRDGKIAYGDFPDALARLYGALHAQPGRFIVVNAKPGHEFKAQLTPYHLSGAAHGSLHRQESLVPLIIAGTNEKPVFPRMIDLKEYILRLI